MRKQIIRAYPTLSAIHLETIPTYLSNKDELAPENLSDGSTALSCNGSPWIPKDEPLSISVDIDADALSNLKNATSDIIPKEAVAGLALSWQSKGSLKSGVSAPVSLDFTNQEQSATLKLNFPSSTIRETLSYECVLFLQSPAPATQGGAYKCNTPGTILGTPGETYTIRADGQGSVFPLFPIAGEQPGSLWSLDCNWTDCMHDRFDSESLRITINTNHPDCPEEWIDAKKKLPLSPLTKLITRDAIATLILTLQREDGMEIWNTIKRSESATNPDFSLGSVAHALWHFYRQYELNDETPAALMESCGKIKL